MQNARAFLTILLAIALFSGCASLLQRPATHTTVMPDEFGKEYSPEELRSDIDFLFRTLEEVHPNLYAHTPKSELDSLRRLLEQKLTTPLSRTEFYFPLASLIARAGDAHTNVSVPWEEYGHFRTNGGAAFPFNVGYDTSSGLTIARSYSADSVLTTGDRIVCINGLGADSLFAAYLDGFGGEMVSFRQKRVMEGFRRLVWCSNITPPYDLVALKYGTHQRIERHVAGATLRDVVRTDSLLDKRASTLPDYRFDRLQEGIGCIDFRSMSGDLGQFREFLSATFAEIHAHPVHGLIIDLRNNVGGNSEFGSSLLSFLTDSSYRTAARKEWKMSAQYKAHMRQMIPWWLRWFPVTWVSTEARRHLGAPDGEIVIDVREAERPDENSLRYRGKTCFLIGPVTFSSGMMLANAVADYRLATLIGEETGGVPTEYGEVYSFDLPNTRISIGVSSAFFIRANGDTTSRRGVLPDIEVRQTEEDLRSGKDAVLERARHWVLDAR